jgi:hypothetical protein
MKLGTLGRRILEKNVTELAKQKYQFSGSVVQIPLAAPILFEDTN